MVVIAVVFSGLAQLLVSSFRSVAVSEERLRATQIASEAIEELQALEWDRIGFYSSQNPPTPVVDGHSNWTVVNLGTTLPTTRSASRRPLAAPSTPWSSRWRCRATSPRTPPRSPTVSAPGRAS
ncbi:MAG TPA: hypothetical protein VNU01_06245, partial [Egibacteraceae bacterium]|nr:hypothetical protein [Egibacteraceae bacterium]